MRIAITGASGRVGHAILEMALEQGHSVVSIDRVPPAGREPKATFIQADIADYAAFEQALRGCQALVHMAAIPSPGRHPDYVVHNNNVVGSYNALRAAAELGIRRVCQASSVNATGAVYSRRPHFDYFPLDERHPTYNEDPYSLSKWICEVQAESIARRYEGMTIASLRFHWVVPERATAAQHNSTANKFQAKHLWGYTRFDCAAQACLMSLTGGFNGAEAFYIIAPDTAMDAPSLDLAREYYPDVPVRGDLTGRRGFFDCSKAERLLGWTHPAG
jgi:UDP-glucose 4-epimerase